MIASTVRILFLTGGYIAIHLKTSVDIAADFLIQSGLAKQIRFHGKRFAWFVSDG